MASGPPRPDEPVRIADEWCMPLERDYRLPPWFVRPVAVVYGLRSSACAWDDSPDDRLLLPVDVEPGRRRRIFAHLKGLDQLGGRLLVFPLRTRDRRVEFGRGHDPGFGRETVDRTHVVEHLTVGRGVGEDGRATVARLERSDPAMSEAVDRAPHRA